MPVLVLPVCFGLVVALFPALSSPGSLFGVAVEPLFRFYYLPIPFCIGIALLRYHLWDIDVLINRTLVYGLLTGLLGALYAGLILGLESLAGLFGGQATSNPLVLVISTLAIYVLFQPLRRRIQALIDRRFYRRKYDAAKIVAAFSATLRQEVDLDQVREQLLAVVQETMQPTHVSLWLRSPQQRTEEPRHLVKSNTMEEDF